MWLSAGAYAQFPYQVGQLGTGDFTVMFDYATNYTGYFADVVSNRDVNNHGNWLDIRLCGPQSNCNGQIRVEIDQDASGTNYNIVQGGSVNDGQWHRIAAVRQGKQLSLAIDGVVVASQAGPGVADIEAYSSSGQRFNPLMLGTLINGFAPTGMFNNLTVYDRALTSAELAGVAAPSAFQDFATAPTAWTNVSGTWTWDGSSSLTVAAGTPGAVTWLPRLSVSDFAVETRMKLDDDSGCAGILLRGMNWTATNNGGQQYYVTVYPGQLIVGKNNNGWTQLGSVYTTAVVPGTYNTYRVEAIGSEIDVYIDNVLTLSVHDSSYASGGIGLKSFYGGATYDYVHVMPDLARGKATTQSATAYGGVSSRAVDGNTDGVYADGSITHTNIATGQWWQVDLGQISSVTNLVVWSRVGSDCSDCQNRLQNYDVETSVDGSNWNHNPFPGTVPQRLVVPINGAVRYVMVAHTAATSTTFAEPISLAEVTAWGTACGPDQIAVPGGSCTPCPAGLVTTDGATCVSPLPVTPFGGADYISRLVAVDSGLCMVAENTTTVHPLPCSRHTTGWWLNQVADPATGGTAYLLRTGNRCLVADAQSSIAKLTGTSTVHATAAGCAGGGNLWNIEWNSAGHMQLHNEQTNLCLAISSTGSILEARACTGETDELWNPDTIRPRAFTTPLVVRGETGLLGQGLCLELDANGALHLNECQAQPTAAQGLQLTSLDDGSVLIQGDGGNCLTVPQGAGAGAYLVAQSCDNALSQRWAMVPLDGGGISLVSLSTGYCVDLNAVGNSIGFTPLQQPCDGTGNQIFDEAQTTGSIPMQVSLQQIGSTSGTALVITGDAGVHVTTDPIAIGVAFQASGLDLTDPATLQQLLQLLNPQQSLTLQAALSGPDGLGGSVAMNWSPINPAAFSVSGTYNDGFSNGTFHLRPYSIGGTNTQNYGYGVSTTVDWSVNPLNGNVGIKMVELDSPIGRGTFYLSPLSLLTGGQVGGTIQIGSFSLGLTIGSNGVSYTGPFDQVINTDLLSYVNGGLAYDTQLIRRGAVDVLTASRSWGQYAYGNATSWVAGVATGLTNAIASGYTAIANAATTAVDAIEDFFGTIGSWF